MNCAPLWAIQLFWTDTVQADYTLNLQITDYQNSKHALINGSCCDPNSGAWSELCTEDHEDECDNYLRIRYGTIVGSQPDYVPDTQSSSDSQIEMNISVPHVQFYNEQVSSQSVIYFRH